MAICYEIADGAGLIGASQAGAGWILASANLDPYPRLLQQQFQALAQLRAIEASRWLVSAANSGPSLVVRPDGGPSNWGRPLVSDAAGDAGGAVAIIRTRAGPSLAVPGMAAAAGAAGGIVSQAGLA